MLGFTLIPIMLNTSETRDVFIILSKGEELLRDGLVFTSKSQGFKVSSIIMSNPYNSKNHSVGQLVLNHSKNQTPTFQFSLKYSAELISKF